MPNRHLYHRPAPTLNENLLPKIKQALKEYIEFLSRRMVEDRTKRNMSKKTLKKLTCSYCESLLQPPIFVVAAHKYICSRCNDAEFVTPKVSYRFTDLEKLIEDFPYTCKYENRGCKHLITLEDTLTHEKLCRYRSMSCPLKSKGVCEWDGLFLSFIDHCKAEHKDEIVSAPFWVREDFTSDFERIFLMTQWSFTFLVTLRNDTQQKRCFMTTYLLDEQKFDLLFMNVFKAIKKPPTNNLTREVTKIIKINHVEETLDIDMKNVLLAVHSSRYCSVAIGITCARCLDLSPFPHSRNVYLFEDQFYCNLCINKVKLQRLKEMRKFRDMVRDINSKIKVVKI